MSDNKIIHFEQLWEQAEKLSSQRFETNTVSDIISELADLVENLGHTEDADIEPEAKLSMKKRFIGEILFHLTAISAKDNINVYGALKEQIFLNQLATKQH